MSAIPSNLTRAPNILIAGNALGTITRTNLSLFQVQNQIATGRSINRFSDDSVKAAAISILDDRLERSLQRMRNLDHASASLNTLDRGLGDASDLVLEAKRIASEQANSTSSAEERESQATVIDSLLSSLFGISNRQSPAGYMFAGSTPGSPAVAAFMGGYRYMGQGNGLLTDIDLGSPVPITLGAGNAIGSMSSRVRSNADLNPGLTLDTRVADLRGARGLGVSLGEIEFSFDGGPRVQIDLTGADTVRDIATRITSALEDYESANSVTILGPGGVSVQGEAISIDVAPGGPPDPQLNFFDPTGGLTAADLGLDAAPYVAGSTVGTDLDPKLTWRTPVAALHGLGALGSIKINNLGQSRTIDLSTAVTLEDVKNQIEGTGLGLRVELSASGNGFDVVNEVAAGRNQAMSIEEVAGNNLTATRLGIRTLGADTRISAFNDGRGVQIADGRLDPSGAVDPALNSDFEIRLGDAPPPGGTSFSVDLRPEDMATVQTLIDRINQQAVAAGISVPANFEAGLSDTSNGIVLRQNGSYAGALSVTTENNSPAADQLGLLDGSYDGAGTFRSEDRAKVRVDNLFTNLIDLRDALRNNDTTGITLAGEKLESSTSHLAQTRALIGAYAQRVEDGAAELEDQDLADQATRSNLRDLDYTEAAIRLSLLQTQLQAGLQVTASTMSRSLLDFLG